MDGRRGRGKSVKISEMNWQQIESYLETDDRCVLPLGSTEQHAFISLATDSILAERVSSAAADPLRIPCVPRSAVRTDALLHGLSGHCHAVAGDLRECVN